jgi:uncharacterized protein
MIYTLNGEEFEWDEEKYAGNLWKHQVTFEEASEVFFDPEQQFGDAFVEDEIRDYIIGYSWSNRMLLVVYVERGWRTRIISARPASSHERKIYE